MTIGEKIRISRKRVRITAAELGDMVGITGAGVSKIELGLAKNGPSPEMVIKIAEALNDRSILTHALMENPICKRIVPRAFEPLNNIKKEASVILEKLAEEQEEAAEARQILARIFTHKEPESQPQFKAVLLAKLEQLLDVQRAYEELIANLKEEGYLTEEDHLALHLRQHAKCIAHGHHRRIEEAD